jgi:hypothetical protein
MSWIFNLIFTGLLKNWRLAGAGLLAGVFLFTLWLAQERGRERNRLSIELAQAGKNYATQIRLLEQARQDQEERHEFKTQQDRKFRAATNSPVTLDVDLRAAYDSLRERQRTHSAR